MDQEIRKYLDIITKALSCVKQQYYNLETTYDSAGIVRERVFCYELYHQIRCIQTKRHETKLSLNGEIDKRGHHEFDKEDWKNPDFVFHIPGKMSGNSIVIEVKGTINYVDECVKDFCTLTVFVSKYKYELGIFILYNHTLEEFITSMKEELHRKFSSLPPEMSEKILILCKKNAQTKHDIYTLKEIL